MWSELLSTHKEAGEMVSNTQAKALIKSLVNRGESLDPKDLTMFYGWVYSSYVALEPFPSEHCKFCERCLDSLDSPERKLRRGLILLRTALGKLKRVPQLPEIAISKDYLNLLHRFLQFPPSSPE
jgi:hypothetical protein